MTSSKILSFLFCCSVLYVDVIATSPYTCKGNIYNITRSNNEEAANLFQRWLQWRQNQADRCESGKVESSTQYGFGLGASILESIKKMLIAIETGEKALLILVRYDFSNIILSATGRIYRPHSTWLWSEDQYPENCTMGVKVIDCFSLPLSQCFKVKEQFKILPYAFPDPYKGLYDKSTEDLRNPDRDICDMGAMAAKPTIWVLGQLLFYHLRSNPTIEAEVQKRVRAALEPPSPLPPGSLTLAMHIRSGMDKYEVPLTFKYSLPLFSPTVLKLFLLHTVCRFPGKMGASHSAYLATWMYWMRFRRGWCSRADRSGWSTSPATFLRCRTYPQSS